MIKKILLTLVIFAIPSQAFALSGFFSDVYSDTPYLDAITWSYDEGITQGYENGNWGPDDCVTRAQILKMMVEYEFAATGGFEEHVDNLDLPSKSGFSDVLSKSWYYDYVRYAKETNVVSGYSDGTFKPDKCVNRVEAMKIAVNQMFPDLGLSMEEDLLFYDDKVITDMDGNAWYSPYARALFSDRLVGTQHTKYDEEVGSMGQYSAIKFFPEGSMTRKEVVFMMMEISEKFPALGN